MTDKDYMQRAIELAKMGGGWTNPNPNVGAVIVKDGRIIGEGYHKKCGELHAERNAFAALTEDAEGATIYVTLEPCCHYGKTPPCTEVIIEHKIARVVIGSRDPNPLVAGKGAALLREKGILVEEDFMRRECDALNTIFFHYITTGKPYVTMKYAMTLDGKIATRTGASKWITGEKAREHVHRLRSRYAGIMAGIETVLADDPMLNARMTGAHQPLRIVLDTRLRIPEDCNLVKTAKDYPTLIVCGREIEMKAESNMSESIMPEKKTLECSAIESKFSVKDIPERTVLSNQNDRNERSEKKKRLQQAGVEVVEMPCKEGHIDLQQLMEYLGERKIDSVLIEGGGRVHEAALKAGIVNHVCAYIAPKIFGGKDAKTPVEGEGIDFPDEAAQFRMTGSRSLGQDILLEYDLVKEMKVN